MICVNIKKARKMLNTPKLPESIKNYLIIPFMESCNCSQHSIDGVVEIFEKAIAQELATLKAQVRREIEGAEKLLIQCVDLDECRLDHHGYCQTHGWFSEKLCINEQIKRYLSLTPTKEQKEEK